MHQWIQRVDDTLNSCSEALTVLAEEGEWPQVTIPHFATIPTRPLLDIPGFENVYLAPLVNAEQLPAYLQYTNDNYVSWIADDAQSFRDVNDTTSFAPVGYKNFIASGSGSPVERRSIYWPIWQHSPPPQDYSLVNVDLYDGLGTEIESALSSDDLSWSAITPDNDERRLFSYVLHSVRRDVGSNKEGSPVVAMVVGKMDWVEVFGEILPLTEIPVHLVLQDSCGQTNWTFSFVNGDLSRCKECNAPVSSLEKGVPIDGLGDLRSNLGVCKYDLVSITDYCEARGLTDSHHLDDRIG